MTALLLFLSLYLVPQILCQTQNRESVEALHQRAFELKVPDSSLHLRDKPYDGSDLKKDVLSNPPVALQNNVSKTKPTTCEGTELLLKLLKTLLELLSDHSLKVGKDKYILALMKTYLNDAPETPEKNEMINKIKNIEDNEYKKPLMLPALRDLFKPRTQIEFKSDIPKINQQTCKETLENLFQNAYNTYLHLTAFPLCQQNGEYSNINLDFLKYLPRYRPQDLSFDIKVVNPIAFPDYQSNLNPTGPSYDLMRYLQNQALNKNLDIISILQSYRPGQMDFTRNEHLPNNGDPVIRNELKNNLPFYPANNFVKESLNNPVIDFTKFYNPIDQKPYIYLTPDDSGNVLDFMNNLKPEFSSENLQFPINNTAKHPALNEIVQFLKGGKEVPLNPFINHNTNSPLKKPPSRSLSDTLVKIITPNNVNNQNYPIDSSLFHIMPKETNSVFNPSKNPNLNTLIVLFNKYLPKNNNGQLIVLPNIKNTEELAKLFSNDVLTQNFQNTDNLHQPVLDLVPLEKLLRLLPKDLLYRIFPNLRISNNETPSNIFAPYLPNGNKPNGQVFNSNTNYKDLLNSLFPNLNVPNSNQGNVNIGLNPDYYQNTLPNFDNNEHVLNPNLIPNTQYYQNISPNTLQEAIDYLKPKNPQPELIDSQYPGPSNNKLLVPDWQRLLAVTNLLKLNPRLNKSSVIELTYLLQRPKPFTYRPYYYVKYKLPYETFINNMNNLMSNKRNLRSSPAQLYQKLLTVSNITEISPDLKGIGKDDIFKLFSINGTLINAKVLSGNDTNLNEQLKNIQNLNSEMKTNELLRKEGNIVNETPLNDNVKIPAKVADSHQTNNNMTIKPDF